jgi:NAD(P)-dependent dehydrogenase (short-subunit alcohol dehydrogenase family)
MRLKNEVAIVTGAARGLGQEFCLALGESVHGSFKPGLRVCPAAYAEFRLSRLI